MIDATFEAWRDRLVRYCAKLLGDRHDAEEVVQDVFARLVAAPGDYDLDGRPELLLFRMARNRCVDRQRRRAPTPTADVDVAGPTAREHVELAAALETLPAAERDTLLLTTVDGLGYREVASILGCSLATVAARRAAAILKLRERLSR